MKDKVLTPDTAAATYAYVGALVDELARAGVRHACVCPGSRSTPLTYALDTHPDIHLWMHVDERSCAFFALGLARATGEPVVIACTSGTAAAEFFPAVVEARYGRVPLVVLTADRPPELRDNGAPQAIDQVNLYGHHARWFVDLALPEDSPSMLRYARATAARAVAIARGALPGPVHLNLPLREPLVPGDEDPTAVSRRTMPDDRVLNSDLGPAVEGAVGVPTAYGNASPDVAAGLLARLAGARRGLIVCGPFPDAALAKSAARLGVTLGLPVLVDPLSQGRRCWHSVNDPPPASVCAAYDAVLRGAPPALLDALLPDLVVRVGAPPTSKALGTYLDRVPAQVVVDVPDGWRDPSSRVGTMVWTNPTSLFEAMNALLATRPELSGQDRARATAAGAVPALGWLTAWRDADKRAAGAMVGLLERTNELFEGKAFAALAALLPDGATLFAGNSMPVRDLDTFFPAGEGGAVRFLCNRGANGIDGVVSSALGAAAAGRGTGARPLVLVIGDLSFYHDLNGLLAAKLHALDATIVLLNNDGGGIFSFLPQAAYPDRFEPLFGTPTGLDFAHAAALYGCGFERVETWVEFQRAVAASLTAPGVQIVELRTDRDRNVELHRAVWHAAREALTV